MILIFALFTAFSLFSYACWVNGERHGRRFVARVIDYELDNNISYCDSPGHVYQLVRGLVRKYL